MKKIFFLVILVTCITKAKHAYAQNDASQVFDIPEEKFTREFTVELERKNRIQVSVTSMQVMEYISDIDSILKVFFDELSVVRDSLSGGIVSVRIDYNIDDTRIKKLRIRKTVPADAYFAFINGSPSLLKMTQDTIVIHGRIPPDWLRKSKKFKEADYGKYYFSVTFYLNDLKDILAYKDRSLNDKIRIIREHYKDKWQFRQDERMQLKAYPEITSNTDKGYIYRSIPFLLKKSIEVQNYKDHFVPSITCTPVFIKMGDFIKRQFGIGIEAAFSFENTATDATKTHVNVFAGLTYNVVPLTKNGYWVKYHPDISIAYLVGRSGTQYDKNSFRLALASFSIGNLTTRIQPVIYFNNLFKNVTPSLRIIQMF